MRSLGIASCALFVLFARGAKADEPTGEPAWAWASETQSPSTAGLSELSDREAALQRACGVFEGGLRRLAQKLVVRKARNLPYLDLDGLTFGQRASGEPHVWPRAWIVSGQAMDHETTLKKLAAWKQTFHDIGERRCGVASGYAPDGTQIIAAIALDAVADLNVPLPTKTRIGNWLTVDARLGVPATGAHVVVVGPGGEPHGVPTSFDGSRVVARFLPDRPGLLTVQVVAEVATGPRPALEAQVYCDAEPPQVMPNLTAPGEAAGAGAADGPMALMKMLAALRAEQSLPALRRDARLDAVALAHAQRMKDAHTVGHDVGDGDPAQRLQNAGLSTTEAGENVAHSQSVLLAHRALYQSPSHRSNMVRGEFGQVGIAVLDDADGSVWVAQVFARDLR